MTGEQRLTQVSAPLLNVRPAGPPSFQFVSADPDSVGLAEEASQWPAAYVHLPFCARVCPYCDFAVVPGRDDEMARYVQAVATEIDEKNLGRPLVSVYLGGGTPSRVPPALLGELLSAIAERFGIEPGAEVSLEANPEDWTPANSDQLAERGFDEGLVWIAKFRLRGPLFPGTASRTGTDRRGGGHSQEQWVSIGQPRPDLRYPGRNRPQLGCDPRPGGRALEPDHVSCYALTVERGTPLGRAVAAGAPGSGCRPSGRFLRDGVPAVGAMPDSFDTRCPTGRDRAMPVRYNLAVWGQAEYLAFGMGAHRFRDGFRSHNRRLLDGYLAAIDGGLSPTAGSGGDRGLGGRSRESVPRDQAGCGGRRRGSGHRPDGQ